MNTLLNLTREEITWMLSSAVIILGLVVILVKIFRNTKEGKW
jgi:hypothetical protein